MSNRPHHERRPSRTEGHTTRQERQEHRKKFQTESRVFTYLAILFAAAFLLLLMALFMQQRNNEQTIGSLKESITSIASLDELIETNEALKEENEALQGKFENALDSLTSNQEQLKKARDEVSQKNGEISSWELFYEADTLFRNKMYTRCADLMRELATYSFYATPEGAQDRAKEIRSALISKGYLTADENAVL